MNEIESVEGSLKQMGENVSAVQAAAVPGLAKWGQDKLDEFRGRWDTLSKQVRKTLYVSFCLCSVCTVCCFVHAFHLLTAVRLLVWCVFAYIR